MEKANHTLLIPKLFDLLHKFRGSNVFDSEQSCVDILIAKERERRSCFTCLLLLRSVTSHSHPTNFQFPLRQNNAIVASLPNLSYAHLISPFMTPYLNALLIELFSIANILY